MGRHDVRAARETPASTTRRCVVEEPDYRSQGTTKPPYSYATLICMAMKANKNKMTLSAIYKWIRENFLYYRNADPSWQVITSHSNTHLPEHHHHNRDKCSMQGHPLSLLSEMVERYRAAT